MAYSKEEEELISNHRIRKEAISIIERNLIELPKLAERINTMLLENENALALIKNPFGDTESNVNKINSEIYNSKLPWAEKALIVLRQSKRPMSVMEIMTVIQNKHEPDIKFASRISLNNALVTRCENKDSEIYREKQNGKYVYILKE